MSLDTLSTFMPLDADVQLTARLKRREPEALGDLFTRFGGPILALITRVAGEKETAKALLEETFLTVWNRVAEFEGSGLALSLWILAVARGHALSHLQKRDAPVEFERPQLFNPLPFGREDVVYLRDMYSAWSALGDKHRRIIELAFFQGMSREEIAAELVEPLPSLESDLKTALASLHGSKRSVLPVEPGALQVGQEKSEQTDQRQE